MHACMYVYIHIIIYISNPNESSGLAWNLLNTDSFGTKDSLYLSHIKLDIRNPAPVWGSKLQYLGVNRVTAGNWMIHPHFNSNSSRWQLLKILKITSSCWHLVCIPPKFLQAWPLVNSIFVTNLGCSLHC